MTEYNVDKKLIETESEDKIWQLRKSFIEEQSQNPTAVKLSKLKEPKSPGKMGELADPEKCLTHAEEENLHNLEEVPEIKTDELKDKDSLGEPELKSTSGSPAPDAENLNISEKVSLSQPLLNGSIKNGNIVGNLSTAVSQNSVWSHTDRKEGSVLSFHNVNYSVKVPAGKSGCGCGKKTDKFILQNINGLCGPGMNAILGPTGSGKTSLLDILAGRKDPGGLSGQVLVDGAPQPDNFQCMAGYVIQDDIVADMLTVRENIHFSAALRLPESVTAEQRKQRVEDIIEELGLTRCANTKIGTPLRRGVSGGERKRTNIAMELITRPPVLFLDEPTTGLDATTAYSVMYQLKRLSKKGTTIIFSIHQPRYSIYKLFDKLFLLDVGELLYQGPASEALDYYSSIGYTCEDHNNPSDFFLDVLSDMILPSGTVPTIKTNGEEKEESTEEKAVILEMDKDDDPDTEEATKKTKHSHLVSSFQQSPWHTSVSDKLKIVEDNLSTKTSPKSKRVSYPTSFFTQTGIVGARMFRNMVRNFHTLATQVISAIILSLLVGSIYFQADLSFTSGLQNRVGAFFFIVMNFVFGNMSSVDVFLKDRAVFIHENISGYYRVSVYMLTKVVCDVLPQKVLPGIVFAAISYWMIGLGASAVQFAFFLLNICLTSLTGTMVALLFSATVQTHAIGSLLTALVWTIMMVFSGLLVNLESVPHWLQWIKYVSIFRYSMNAFSINELKDMEFCDDAISSNTTTVMPMKCDTGNEYMDRQGIPHSNTWDLWYNEVMLVAIGTFFLIFTYIQLRRLKKHN